MIRNVHQRRIAAPVQRLGDLLDGLGRPGDRLWPSPAWVPMELDRPLGVGATGGHGPVRYHVVEYEPGRRVRFETEPELGLLGYHEFVVTPLDDDRCVVRHEIVGCAVRSMRVLWPLAVRWLHDAVVEDLLDNAEREATGRVAAPATWSPWVRFLWRHTEFRAPQRVDIPHGAELVRKGLDRIDREDAWQVRLLPGMPTDPQKWAEAGFGQPPRWVGALMRLRNAVVGLVGISRGDRSAFAPLDRSDHEVLVGTDERHLDFRASVHVEGREVTLSTVVKINNRRGRLYLAVVWPIHGLVVRSMLRWAQYSLAGHANHPRRRVPRPSVTGSGGP